MEQETQGVYKTKASVTDIDISLNEIPEERVYVRSISGCLRSETGTCQNVCCIVRNAPRLLCLPAFLEYIVHLARERRCNFDEET